MPEQPITDERGAEWLRLAIDLDVAAMELAAARSAVRTYGGGAVDRALQAEDRLEELRAKAADAFPEVRLEIDRLRAEAGAERERIIGLVTSGEFCRYAEHVQGLCDCKELADAIRKGEQP